MNPNDTNTNLKNLKKRAQLLIDERDWGQFHSPQSISMYLSIEANELMEKFLWVDKKESFKTVDNNRTEIEDEAADVLINLLLFANIAKIDLTQALINKQEKIRKRYPIEKSKGKSDKYNKL